MTNWLEEVAEYNDLAARKGETYRNIERMARVLRELGEYIGYYFRDGERMEFEYSNLSDDAKDVIGLSVASTESDKKSD